MSAKNISSEALKRHAKRLQKEIKKNKPSFKLSEAQDLLAKTFGLNNWHEMNETTKKNEEKNEIEKNYLWYCENEYFFSVKKLLKVHPEINIDIEQGFRRAVKSGNLTTVINTKIHCEF